MSNPTVAAMFDLIGAPVRRDVCVVTATSPLTITWNGETGILAEKINGSTVTTGTAYVYFTKGGKPLVIQTV